MSALALLAGAFVVGFEQLTQWKYGPVGIAGLLLLALGFHRSSPAYSSAGALVLTLLVVGGAAA
ncbi:hypothetical protein [Streptomyces sp. NPDC050560]|uniref:hypothetical protein n=1 Tax=Streptomyces sp. NPDC050560 TaxID=3365630 RepID=UPI0037AC3B45